MYETIITDIKSFDPNLLLGLVASAAVFSGIFYMLKGILGTIFSWIGSALSTIMFYNLTVHYSTDSYPKFNYWLEKHRNKSKFVRDFKTHKVGSKEKIIQGFGTFYLKVKGIPFLIVERSRVEKKNAHEETDIISIKALTFRRKGLDKLFASVDKIDLEAQEFVPSVYLNDDGWWTEIGDIRPVMNPPMQSATDFMTDLDSFFNNKELFRKRKLPFKRGYLLHGQAGTGKTSLVLHAAQTYKMNIYITNTPLGDDMINMIKPNSIILVEDIDLSVMSGNRNLKVAPPVKSNRTPKPINTEYTQLAIEKIINDGLGLEDESEEEEIEEKEEIPVDTSAELQKMLQMLDGITTYDNCIFICTTNDIGALDSALVRPGRIDKKFEVGLLTPDEQLKYYNEFYEQNDTIIGSTESITMAELSNQFLTHIDDHNIPKQNLKIS